MARVRFSAWILAVCVFPMLICLMACSQESPVVILGTAKGGLPSEDAGTLYPMIQKVSPGTLQSLDIPQPYPSDVPLDNSGIIVVFSHIMENDNSEMNFCLKLVEETSPAATIGITVSPASSSNYFTVAPFSGSLKPDTTYSLRVYEQACARTLLSSASVSRTGNVATVVTAKEHGLKNNDLVTITGFTAGPPDHTGYNINLVPAQVIDDTSFSFSYTGADEVSTPDANGIIRIFNRTLVFSNLPESPATSLNPIDPAYVVYTFRTGPEKQGDVVPPTVLNTNPSDSDINVNPDPVANVGYIEFVFNDNSVPMIDPTTVNDESVKLYNVTDSPVAEVPGNIEFVSTDTDFKTYRFTPYPDPYLLPGKEYRLTISNATSGYSVTDFAGNPVQQENVHFTTSP